MQSFLAESAPHRGRAIAFASAGLLVLVTVAATLCGHHRHHAQRPPHRLQTMGHCYYVR